MTHKGMVHALHEAWRVLKPNGLMIDLRPAPVHRRVAVARAGRHRPLGAMREKFDDDLAADRAVAHVVRDGLFNADVRIRFGCNRTMDSLDEFQEWIDEFVQLGNLSPHTWLVRRVERALNVKGSKPKIVVSGPLVLRVLRKSEAGGKRARARKA